MSQFTTGELAELCGVSVRTVQYYDAKGILSPAIISEGGRRLYNEQDLETMKLICYLKGLGLSLNDIGKILKEENSKDVIFTLLTEQARLLKDEIEFKNESLKKIEILKKVLVKERDVTVESIKDVTVVMEEKKKRKNFIGKMFLMTIPLEIIEIAVIVLWAVWGIWIPFAVYMPIMLGVLLPLIIKWYYGKVEYVCPNCSSVFTPGIWKFMFSQHTFKTRKLTCPCCGAKSYCIEKVK